MSQQKLKEILEMPVEIEMQVVDGDYRGDPPINIKHKVEIAKEVFSEKQINRLAEIAESRGSLRNFYVNDYTYYSAYGINVRISIYMDFKSGKREKIVERSLSGYRKVDAGYKKIEF